MAALGASVQRPGETQLPAGLAGRPRYALLDIPALLWRERHLMIAVFVMIFAAGVFVAFNLKTNYPAYSSVLVRLGQEYVYEPRAGDAGRGAVPQGDAVLQSEMEILNSAALKQRVIDRLGLAKIYPKLAPKYAAADPEEKRKVIGAAIRGMERSFKSETAPDTPIIKVSYESEDATASALILNTLLEEYLIHRRAVLGDASSLALEQQRRAFEQRLLQADDAYEQFLNNNRIGDFVAEKASLSQLQAQIEQQKYQTDAQLEERLGRLDSLQRQFAEIAPEVGLFRDLSTAASEKLAGLRVQREELLSRYRADARPVQELNTQIAQLEAAMASGRTQGESARRLGVNPVYQTLQTEKIQLTAEVVALRQAQQALGRQLDQLTARRLRLAQLEPRFQALSLDRDVLQANVRDFTVKEEQSRAAQQLAAASNDNIRIIERALVPTRGKSMKRLVVMAAFVFAAFSALCAGLIRMFLRPGIPTPRSAARTLELPVFGSAALKTS